MIFFCLVTNHSFVIQPSETKTRAVNQVNISSHTLLGKDLQMYKRTSEVT